MTTREREHKEPCRHLDTVRTNSMLCVAERRRRVRVAWWGGGTTVRRSCTVKGDFVSAHLRPLRSPAAHTTGSGAVACGGLLTPRNEATRAARPVADTGRTPSIASPSLKPHPRELVSSSMVRKANGRLRVLVGVGVITCAHPRECTARHTHTIQGRIADKGCATVRLVFWQDHQSCTCFRRLRPDAAGRCWLPGAL